MSSRAARGCFSLRESKDQTEADIYVSFFLILQAKQGNLDISLPSLAPASFPAFFPGCPSPPQPAPPSSCQSAVQPQGPPLCTHQQFWAVKRFDCHMGDSIARRKSFTGIASGHDNDRETSVGWMGGKKKKRGLFTAGALVLLATRPLPCPRPPVSFPFFLPAPCCQLPKDICSHPLLNEKVLMHDFRICQNIQHLQVFGDAANLTTGKRNE